VLRAFHADGSFYWQRALLPEADTIKASPVVDTDGSIYVIGIGSYRDHRVNPVVTRFTSTLYRFVPGGGLIGVTPFPSHTGRPTVVTNAPPTIWRNGDNAAIIITALYEGDYGKDLRLLAFSPGGALLDDKIVTSYVGEVTSSDSVWEALEYLVSCFTEGGCPFRVPVKEPIPQDPLDRLPPDAAPPMPGVALFTYAGGGDPWVIVPDHVHDTVGYTFKLGDGFTERFRKHDKDLWMASPAMALKDGHTVIGKATMSQADPNILYGLITFAGPNATPWPNVPTFSLVFAAPARTNDGRIIVVHNLGFDVLKNGTVQHLDFPSQTMAPAAISCSHVFISTAGAFHTYDVTTMKELATYPWGGGGLSSPAIGPGGEVYALATNTLFVWPAPWHSRFDVPTSCDGPANSHL
jgi:hypothetical protein